MADPNFLTLVHYNAWANRRVVAMLEVLSDEDVARPLHLLSHLLRAERVWLGRLRGTPDAALPLWETDALGVCRERITANTAAFEAALSDIGAFDPSTTISYTTTQGAPYRTPVRDILSHVFNHSTHHRGQIALLVREAGQTPHPLDYIAYVRLADGRA